MPLIGMPFRQAGDAQIDHRPVHGRKTRDLQSPSGPCPHAADPTGLAGAPSAAVARETDHVEVAAQVSGDAAAKRRPFPQDAQPARKTGRKRRRNAPSAAAAVIAQPARIIPVSRRIELMRQSRMSDTAIRRALSLSETEAVAYGIVKLRSASRRENDPAGQSDPARPATVAPEGDHAAAPRRRSAEEGPTMASILSTVSRLAGCAEEAILGPTQSRGLVAIRQLVMILIRQLCNGATCSAIGHFLGRDHTTVLYGLRKAGDRLDNDQDFANLYQRARECCVGTGGNGGTVQAPIARLTHTAAKFPPYDAETGHESRSR